MWMKVDDRLHSHRKTRAVLKSDAVQSRDAAPFGLWVLAGSWSAQNGTYGWVPDDELERFDDGWEMLAQRLVKGGYWWRQEKDGEPGYGFVDWADYNPSPEAASQSGEFGNHVRWHVQRGIVEPSCGHCPSEPASAESVPDDDPESGGDIGTRSGGDIGGNRSTQPHPTPSQPEPHPIVVEADASPAPTGGLALVTNDRPDVDRVVAHLADRIEANGSKRPPIGKTWLDAARLMLDKDGRAEADIHRAIDWCQADEFWRANVLSLPTLREKYDQLRLQAQRKQKTGTRSNDIDWDVAMDRARQIDANGGIA